MKKFNKGFTLIELLVVIAIIGILSSIVLASLSSARTKGEDSAIQANLSNMRAQAELFYANNNNYGAAMTEGVCPTTATALNIFASTTVGGLFTMVDGLNTRAGNANTACSVETSGTAWGAAAILKGDPTKSWCVDSTGASKQYTGTAVDALTTSKCN